MKKGRQIETKIYELLGIKKFRKIVLKFREIIINIFLFWMDREVRKEIMAGGYDNYTMKKGHGLQDLRDFKKMLWINSLIHVIALGYSGSVSFMIINNGASLFSIVVNIVCILVNIYCIMLQRYNFIKINNVLKRGEVIREKRRKVLCEEIKKDMSISLEFKKTNDDINRLNEMIDGATLEQLKEFKKFMEIYFNDEIIDEKRIEKVLRLTKKQ